MLLSGGALAAKDSDSSTIQLRSTRAVDTVGARSRLQFLLLGATICLFLCLHLFVVSGVPVWRGGDQSLFMVHAIGMMRGEVLYRDMFQFNLPGTECLYYVLFRLFGPAAWVVNATMVLTGTAVALLTFALAKKVAGGWEAVAAPLAFVVFAMRYYLDGTHHWYSMLVVLTALLVIAARRTPARLAAAGALFAVATLFTSTRGVFAIAGTIAFLLWEFGPTRAFLKSTASLLMPFLLLIAGTVLYLARIVGMRLLANSLITFPLRYYSADKMDNSTAALMTELSGQPWAWRSLPRITSSVLISFGVPLAFTIFFLAYRRNPGAYRRLERNRTLVLLAAVGVSLVVSVASAASFNRFTPISPLAFLVIFSLLNNCGLRGRRALRGVLIVAVVGGFAELCLMQTGRYAMLPTSHGRVIIPSPDLYADYVWLAQHTRVNDTLFGEPDDNYLLGLNNPTPLPQVTADGYTRPEQVDDVIAGLERHRTPTLVWRPYLDIPDKYDPAADSLAPLRRYLHDNYRLAKIFSDGMQVWQR